MLLRALPVFAFGLPTALTGFFVLVEPFLGPGFAFVAAVLAVVGADFLGAPAFLGASVLVFFAAAGFVAAGLAAGDSFFASFTVPDGPSGSVSIGSL